ncbi:MAG: SDR family NAD(P)-dependent oxidoreductase, partial [Bacteroidales bacterium]
EFDRISHPFTPEMVVYCRSRYLYVEQTTSAAKAIESLRHQLPRFKNEYGFLPAIIVMKNMGVFAVDDTVASADNALDTFEDLIRVSHYATLSGGRKYLDPDQIAFIERWEVENYRRKVSIRTGPVNKLQNKIAVVTGGAQGFGAGIAEALYRLSVNVVVADLNEAAGIKFVSGLTDNSRSNRVVFMTTDVSDPVSVKNLIDFTVNQFGGLDILISNAGILRAGGLDEIEPEVFEKTTEVNYNGYFYCVKYASEAMKLQNLDNPEYFTDIIQINSKSGLRGSNRNFAYAGSKFGSIGLTQSFAMELAPFRIKVNAICPGNFYEGPLWADPHSGLFVQYLRTGKVPGAKTVEDVKRYYEEQVPMKRGCRLDDLIKAILYVIDQEYETGQAIPVTGGQVMLG